MTLKKREREFVVAFLIAGLLTAPALLAGISWRGVMAVFCVLGAVALMGFFGRSKSRIRLENLMKETARNPAVDFSSDFADEIPALVIAYRDALRSLPRPRSVRPNSATRVAIWLVRLLPVIMGFLSVRDLLVPTDRVPAFPGPDIYILLLACSILVWFLVPIGLKKEPRLGLLASGEVALARATRSAGLFGGYSVSFQFHDEGGRRIEARGKNSEGLAFENSYIPIFYDPQNPANCAPACAFSYEIVLPQNSAALHLLGRV